MSFSFHVTCAPPEADFHRVFPVPFTPLEPAPTGLWPDGTVLRGFIPDVSTRCVETSWRNGRFEARILALSCPEDYALALAICRAVAGRAGVWVHSEEDQWFDPMDLETYGSEWVDKHVQGVNQAVLQMAQDQDEPLEVLGLAEPYLLQKDFAKELLQMDEPSRQVRLFAHIREVVYGSVAHDTFTEQPTADAAPRVPPVIADTLAEASVETPAPVAPEAALGAPGADADVSPVEPSATGISSAWVGVGVVCIVALLCVGCLVVIAF